ncbi:Imm1 family immunity protein [Actinokineospora diospyrosa]|uniref:Immunity protein Imm1 n=1 Tax=Actinokineospora diospyrosa TaxID=103728 RepID=A0ABT1IDZ2_9PSEU|nr:Imm1 family immunity protein [Actinokineospora diospyrosa]MCP2270866.1 Immunity protein Imm1 [Actinokineospora diospyrosa]
MDELNGPSDRTILTASLTTGVARVAHGIEASTELIAEVLRLDHNEWETILLLGDQQFHQTKNGPFPDQQLRVTVRPTLGYAALNHSDTNSDPPIANSYNPRLSTPDLVLIFNGSTRTVFPRTAAIPIADAQLALDQWLLTQRRPTCINWQPFDHY